MPDGKIVHLRRSRVTQLEHETADTSGGTPPEFVVQDFRTPDNRITGASRCSLSDHTPAVRSLRLVVSATNAITQLHSLA
jgi:hypothetical protein